MEMNFSLLKTPLWNGSWRGNYIWPEITSVDKACSFFSTQREESESISHAVVSDSATPWPARLLYPWNSPVKNTGVGSHSLLQRIFLTQGSNPSLQHCGQILYNLSHQGGPTQRGTRLPIWLWKDSSVEVLTWLLSWVANRWSCLPQHFLKNF